MSTPINHHYVSRCQIKQFFNKHENKIFLYDKAKKNFYSSISSKNIFSEKFSNSIYRNGQVDHESLENELKVFEDFYPITVQLITDTARTGKIYKECYDALVNLTLFGIAGSLRNPERKKELDEIIDNMFNPFKDHMSEDQLKGIAKAKDYKKHVRYSNTLSYSDTALRIVENMGGLDFTIWSIESDDCFLLPDTSALTVRRQINEFNPHANEIVEIGFPLTDKLFIHALSKKLNQKKSIIAYVDINNFQAVTDINQSLFHFAYNTIATSNEEYLRSLVTEFENEEI